MPQSLEERYLSAVHRMQSAEGFRLAAEIRRKLAGGTGIEDTLAWVAKHLRVGVNSGLSSHAALVDLLVEKGVFTAEEYEEQMVVWAEREADARVAEVRAKLGLGDGVTFG